LVVEMNPIYLAKDELLYELHVRGVNSDSDATALRKLFRTVVTRGLAVDISLSDHSVIGELLGQVESKISELQTLVTTTTPTVLPTLVKRVKTKVSHFCRRLAHIEATGQAKESALIEKLRAQLGDH
jgi:hypothetical protein